VEYSSLEQKIRDGQVMLDDIVQFQTLVDSRVKYLLDLCPEDLYQVKPVTSSPRPVETASVCFVCAKCGQQVLKSRIVDYEGKAYCLPCFQRLNTGCTAYSLQ
jgi:formylmethanofuran dehydrogenase subunit E